MDFIYSRQSVDKADSISIESQIEYCRYETRGGPCRIFSDKGYSGKNTDRPAFRRMMEALRQGGASRVIVYKLDRISRSILDFAGMIEEFQHLGVEFVSCTEKFDTATPMGRAMLSICIVFAQLERETIQMRVADAYAARMKHGFFMGGHVPYGFALEDAVLDGVHTRRYVPQPEEAEHIRLICALYADRKNSIGDVLRLLEENGVVNRRGRPWTRERVRETIRNPVYVRAGQGVYEFYQRAGTEMLSEPELFAGRNGCFLFSGESGKRKQTHPEAARLLLAPHEGLVDEDVWLACRRRCMGNRPVAAGNKAKWTWLAGRLKCASCGYALTVKRATNGSRYLVCSHRYAAHGCTAAGLPKADAVERLAGEAVRARLAELGPLEPQRQADTVLAALRARLAELESEREALAARIPQANEQAMCLINERAAALTGQAAEIRRRLAGRRETEAVPPDGAAQWESLCFEGKRAVLDVLVQKVTVSCREVCITWRI